VGGLLRAPEERLEDQELAFPNDFNGFVRTELM
jgi:hypothetical protein